MAILFDARANEIKGNFPDTVTNETVSDARTATATLAAANAEVIMDLNGAKTASFDVRTGAGALSFVFEGTIDGTNYLALPAFALNSTVGATLSAEVFVNTVTVATTITASYVVEVSGLRRVRLRVSAFTSGNIVVAARATSADALVYVKQVPTTLWVTVTAAANTAATITLPAAGVGLFHYITYLSCMRNATGALAGSATLIITTTNLTGSPAWSVGNAMSAGGTANDVDFQPSFPLKSSVANTATTIVLPAPGLAVLQRGNCAYFVGA